MLGSLINPSADKAVSYGDAFSKLQPLLDEALKSEQNRLRESVDTSDYEMTVTAQGVAKAAEILAGQFTLVATNVPYLGRGKQDEVLQDYCERVHPQAKADLATCFVERCLDFCSLNGSTALVTPQNWLFLGTYQFLRVNILKNSTWNCLARLGPKSFQTPMSTFIKI